MSRALCVLLALAVTGLASNANTPGQVPVKCGWQHKPIHIGSHEHLWRGELQKV